MEQTNQNQNTTLSPQTPAPVLALPVGRKKARNCIQPSITYELANDANLAQLDKAFDILFEETLRKNADLTAYDN